MNWTDEIEEQEQMIVDDYNAGLIDQAEMNRQIRELHKYYRDLEEQNGIYY